MCVCVFVCVKDVWEKKERCEKVRVRNREEREWDKQRVIDLCCVREGEKEWKGRKRERMKKRHSVCVCVCKRERERESEQKIVFAMCKKDRESVWVIRKNEKESERQFKMREKYREEVWENLSMCECMRNERERRERNWLEITGVRESRSVCVCVCVRERERDKWRER